ncbi:MAG TPA: hypothetical protein VMB78_06205 [Dissulfurispiraceae bacterium]|nr:hypothetical protein [Dissulfurispiraceae bacterium]
MKRNTLLAALFILALSGLLLHIRIHFFMVPDRMNPGSSIFDPTRFLSFIFPLFDVVVVTLLFMSRKTAAYGYLFNGLIVIYGTIFMAHFSLAEMTAKSIPLSQMLLKSTLPDIGISWADFFVGKALYDYYLKGGAIENNL